MSSAKCRLFCLSLNVLTPTETSTYLASQGTVGGFHLQFQEGLHWVAGELAMEEVGQDSVYSLAETFITKANHNTTCGKSETLSFNINMYCVSNFISVVSVIS